MLDVSFFSSFSLNYTVESFVLYVYILFFFLLLIRNGTRLYVFLFPLRLKAEKVKRKLSFCGIIEENNAHG